MNHPMNFPPPPRIPQNMNNQQQQQRNYNNNQQQNKRDQREYKNKNRNDSIGSDQLKDEYAGLMVNREKQWLLNIQLLQVNTGTPYFDDYYYTVRMENLYGIFSG